MTGSNIALLPIRLWKPLLVLLPSLHARCTFMHQSGFSDVGDPEVDIVAVQIRNLR